MSYEPVSTANRSELTSIIRDIRNRWRLKLAVRGAAFVVAGFLLTLLVSAYSLETLKFSPGSIIAFRVAMVMILGVLSGYFFVLPQWRRVTDEQVALYLEECEPTLETAILSALEAEKGSSSHSPELARRLSLWRPRDVRYKAGVFAKYCKLVSSASEGAVTRA